ncbi:MAG: Crp/Fnr family transcriptional regulator [Deltaproteobacteria bacterium]|nr:Crp/Fnr family transcriptional regulator [Deltaproteobacteria bacterium]MCL5792662.1 Crp/Fnr family transcriptional regulator [Deltaproteobacteria bacterium]
MTGVINNSQNIDGNDSAGIVNTVNLHNLPILRLPGIYLTAVLLYGVSKNMSNETIKCIDIFSEFTENELSKLSQHLTQRHVNKNATLFYQNDPGDALYFISKGEVRIYLIGLSGREITLAVFKDGQFFGEMSLLDGMPRSASAITTEDTDFLVLKRDNFIEVVKENPEIGIKLLEEMSRRLREADGLIENLALRDVYERLEKHIVKLIKSYGKREGHSMVLSENIKRQDIANAIGTTRETVSRILSAWQRKGYIQVMSSKMIIYRDFEADFIREK